MKTAMLRLPVLLLLFTCLLLSACQRSRPAAEVVYRTSQEKMLDKIVSADIGEVDSKRPVAKTPKFDLPSDQVKIGIVLPLSGPQAAIGNQLRDAALMGLYDAIESSPRLGSAATPELIVKDNESSPAKTRDAVKALLEEGVHTILGPLVASNVEVAAKLTRPAGIPLISFSNDVRVANDGVYVFGFIPKQQVVRIADYAVQSQVKYFSAVAPQNEYGRMVIRDFSGHTEVFGHTLRPVEFHPSDQPLPASSEVRIMEYLAGIGRERKGLFVPTTGPLMASVIQRLRQDARLDNGYLKLLGTGVWDRPESLADAAMLGAWFSTTPPERSLNYNERFNAQYQYVPSRIASLAYDAVRLIADYGVQNGPQAITNNMLIISDQFDLPANGTVRFNTSGVVDRALAVVEIVPGGFRVIDPPRFLE